MTICLVISTMLVLLMVSALPELMENCDALWQKWNARIEYPSYEAWEFLEGIELYGDFWFQKDVIEYRVWRQKNAKCAWAPAPPLARRLLSM